MLGILGLFVILLGWMIQFVHTESKQRFHPFFLLANAAGIAFLVLDSFANRNLIAGSLELLLLCVVMLNLSKLK